MNLLEASFDEILSKQGSYCHNICSVILIPQFSSYQLLSLHIS